MERSDSSRVHISIITETFPPEVNGVAMTLHQLAVGLAQEGHRIEVVRPRQKTPHEPPQAFTEVEVGGLPLPGYQGLRFGLPCKRRLLRQWKAQPPDVLYVATEGPLGLSAVGAALKLGIPVTSGFHTNFNQYMKHYAVPGVAPLMAGYLRWFHNRTWCTYTPSPTAQSELTNLGLRNVRVLGRGVDTRQFHPAKTDDALRRDWGIQPGGIAPVFVSRIAAEKNLALTTSAFREICQSVPGSVAVFVGDGPELPKLRREFPDFHFAGMKRGEDLARHYASGDLFIFPSITETFGNVITEAMASGLVVVAYDYAAPHLYIVDGVNGFLAPFNQPEAFPLAVKRALEARDRWPEIRKAARKTAESLTWSNIVHQFVQTLEEAAASHDN